MAFAPNDETLMRQALELAREGIGLASPNPRVGAVVVRDGNLIGRGSYTYDGVKHAEVLALEQAGEAAEEEMFRPIREVLKRILARKRPEPEPEPPSPFADRLAPVRRGPKDRSGAAAVAEPDEE